MPAETGSVRAPDPRALRPPEPAPGAEGAEPERASTSGVLPAPSFLAESY